MPQNKDRLYVALYARGGSATMPGKEDTLVSFLNLRNTYVDIMDS